MRIIKQDDDDDIRQGVYTDFALLISLKELLDETVSRVIIFKGIIALFVLKKRSPFLLNKDKHSCSTF